MAILETAPSRYWTTRDGVALHYRDTEKPGTCWVLLHGLADGEYIWHGAAEAIAASHRVVTIELRGHGQSAWDAQGRYDLEIFTDDIAALLQARRIVRPVIMGHSLGAKIAARVAASCRLELKALVVIDSGPKEETSYYAPLRLSMLEGCQTYKSREDYVAWLLRTRPFASETTLARIAELSLEDTAAGFTQRLDPRVVDILITETNDEWWWDALRKIECPVMIVRGRASGILSKVIAQRMLACLRDGRLEIVPGAGHGVMTDNPSGFLAVVTRFMREIETLPE